MQDIATYVIIGISLALVVLNIIRRRRRSSGCGCGCQSGTSKNSSSSPMSCDGCSGCGVRESCSLPQKEKAEQNGN